jgi:uncharacterized protein (TIGR02270 family)
MSDQERRGRVMIDVLEEHLEELDFLWEQRERFVFAPGWTVQDLANLEERAEAHLDGLRIGGEAAIEIARPFLAGDEKGAATAAAFTFLASDDPGRAREVLAALAGAPEPAADGIRIALRHSEVRLAEDGLYDLALGPDLRLRALAADVLTFHRLRPPPEIEGLLDHEDGEVRALGFAAAGRAGKVLTARHLEGALKDEQPHVRAAGLEAAARCGLAELPSICRRAAGGYEPVPEALEFLGVVGGPADVRHLETAMRDAAVAPVAILAAGDLGNPALVPALLTAMGDAGLSELAAVAFSRITGVEVPRLAAPATAAAGDRLADTQALPPDVDRLRAIWDSVRDRLPRAQRCERGQDLDCISLAAALRSLPLRSRRVFYLARRHRDPGGVPDVELERRVRRP